MADGNFTNTIPRDRNDRPYIYPPPAKGKTHADTVAKFARQRKNPPSYRRTTKFISVLEDTYNLDKWAERTVARGVAERDDLIEAIRAIRDIESKAGKDELNRYANDAKAQMRTGFKSALGSYLHHCTELKDIHGDAADLPSPVEWASLQNSKVDLRDDDYPLDERDADVAAYLAMKARYGLRFSAIEQMRVFDPWQVAGTPDRIGTGADERFGSKWMVLDVKTGDIDWDNTRREHAIQFAMYAHSTAYTHEDGRIDDVPPVDRNRAVVIHLPVMQAKCELHFVDIVAGWDGAQRAQQVWEWRKRRDIFTKLDDWEPANHLEKLAQSPSFAEAAMLCASADELRALWGHAAAGMGLTDGFKAAVKKRLAELGIAA